MITFSSTKKLYIETLKGNAISVPKLSIKDTEIFRSALKDLNEEVEKEAYKTVGFTQGYTELPLFKLLVDNIFSLFSINCDDLPAETAYNLLFPHALEDGSYNRQGLLARHILGEPKEGGNVPKEQVDYYAKTIGDLWASFSDIKHVMDIISNLDYEGLAEVMKHRNEALKPAEQKEKEKSVKKAKEALSKIKKGVSVGQEIDFGDLF